jgi:hypothetical protein
LLGDWKGKKEKEREMAKRTRLWIFWVFQTPMLVTHTLVPGIVLPGDPSLFPSSNLKTAKKNLCSQKEREKERRI